MDDWKVKADKLDKDQLKVAISKALKSNISNKKEVVAYLSKRWNELSKFTEGVKPEEVDPMERKRDESLGDWAYRIFVEDQSWLDPMTYNAKYGNK